ncbi:MAG: hypothetical protein CFE21_14700 [Bacteroidetes bacterium B1(2017)]|nr:MAG: hypothetical protein CFE21_14700 [Bacteroidetes bacterium B1(2017)]
MRKGYFLFIFLNLLVCDRNLIGQIPSLYELKNGKISFFSYAPQEIIKASSDKIKGLINPSQNTFAVSVENSSFGGFNSALQQEHFNERFIESNTYTFSSYSGKIIDKVDWLKDGTNKVRVKGKLIIHGISQERILPVVITIKNGQINVSASFKVFLSDYEINIPSIVNQKISEQIDVAVNVNFEKK